MKQTVILAVLVLATAGLASAAEPVAGAAEAKPPAATTDLTAEPLFADGSCEMPDLAGLSREEIAAAVFAAGLEESPSAAAAPACPVAFQCNSITNCGASDLCAVQDIGPCCDIGPGLTICCVTGTIKVKRCRCRCTSDVCSFQCLNSIGLSWGCQ